MTIKEEVDKIFASCWHLCGTPVGDKNAHCWHFDAEKAKQKVIELIEEINNKTRR